MIQKRNINETFVGLAGLGAIVAFVFVPAITNAVQFALCMLGLFGALWGIYIIWHVVRCLLMCLAWLWSLRPKRKPRPPKPRPLAMIRPAGGKLHQVPSAIPQALREYVGR